MLDNSDIENKGLIYEGGNAEIGTHLLYCYTIDSKGLS